MQKLIKIGKNEINHQIIKTANARDLHAFLESKQDFSTWMKKRISDYGFIENQDFIRFHKKMEANNAIVIDYHISLDMAKELSMVERNEKGKKARQYFIKCEKRANVLTGILDHWKEPSHTPNNPAIQTHPIQKEPSMNDNIIQLARVVAEATASATMKACIEATGHNAAAPALPAPQYTPSPTSMQADDEYAPVSKAAYATGLADSACRRLIKVAHIPIKSKGLRGLRVHIPTFLEAANDVMHEATPPHGNRKRWSHPKLGSFTYRGQLSEQQA